MLPASCRRCLAPRCGPGLMAGQQPGTNNWTRWSIQCLYLGACKLASDGYFKIYGMFMRINKGTLKLFHGWRWGPHSQNFNHLFVWWGMWTFSGISILRRHWSSKYNREWIWTHSILSLWSVCVFKFNIYNIMSLASGAGLLWKLCNSKTVNVISDLNWCHGSAWHVSYR